MGNSWLVEPPEDLAPTLLSRSPMDATMDGELGISLSFELESSGGLDESGEHLIDPPAETPSRGHDRALFAREVLAHRAELVASGARLSGSRAEAEDLVQEAILRAWVFFDRFQPGTNGRAWMHRILFNTFVNGYRRRRREREILGQIHATELHASKESIGRSALPTEALSDEVQAALKKLHPDFRRVIEIVDLDERSYRDAALLLGCPIGTVMSRLHRARRAMKRELESYAEAEGWQGDASSDAAEPVLEAA